MGGGEEKMSVPTGIETPVFQPAELVCRASCRQYTDTSYCQHGLRDRTYTLVWGPDSETKDNCIKPSCSIVAILQLCSCYVLVMEYKGKGKTIPLQAWIIPQGSRRLRLPGFMTIGA
jgi:hypothetical protein